MISKPTTYAEWIAVITEFKNRVNDDDVLNSMRQGTLVWQTGIAERFSQKLIDAVNSRMNTAVDKFQRDFSRSKGQEGAIVQAILALRKEMSFLVQAIDLPAIPSDKRQAYVNMVYDQADKMQKSLEDSALHDRSGKMSSIVRNHKVNRF